MSNSSRIEAATRQHVGATLTSEQIVELVKISNPEWKGGVYPSDAAYTRTPEGLKPRGATAYGDGVLEYLGANSFKVLKTEEIVRRPGGKKAAVVAAPAAASAPTPVAPAAKAEKRGKKGSIRPTPTATTSGSQTSSSAGNKKAATTASSIPVATKQKGADRHAAQ